MTATTNAHRVAGTDPEGDLVTQADVARPSLLFISRKWTPAVGGMETYSVKLSGALARFADVETKVLPGRDDGSAPTATSLLIFGLSAVAAILFRRRVPQVIHVADMSSWPLALIARLRAPRSKVVLSAHGTDVSFPDRAGLIPRIYGAYMRLGAALLGTQPIIANSHATKEKTEALGFKVVHVVPLATDMERVDAAPETNKRLLFAGRLIESKGCRWFVENVLPLLPDDVMLDVAGTVWDASEKAAFDHPRVTFLGPLPQTDLAKAYASAGAVILPNIASAKLAFEGFGLVAAEAAAAGGVVLAAAHSGLNDAVLDGETGFKLPPGDADAWAASLRDVLNWSPEYRAEFTSRASTRARDYFSWDRVAERTFDAYGVKE